MGACTQAYGAQACQATFDARKQEGVIGCPNIENVEDVNSEATGSCPCFYDGRVHHCNPSPFKNDNRCVCGPKQSDWKTPDQCKENPAPKPAPQNHCTMTAAGQRSIYSPGCSGTGCGTPDGA